MADPQNISFFDENSEELEAVGKALLDGEIDDAVASVAGIVATAVAGPGAGGLAKVAASKFLAAPANVKLRQQAGAWKLEQNELRRLESVRDAVEGLLGQMLIQVVRTQQSAKEELLDKLDGLGGAMSDFRAAIEAKLEAMTTTDEGDPCNPWKGKLMAVSEAVARSTEGTLPILNEFESALSTTLFEALKIGIGFRGSSWDDFKGALNRKDPVALSGLSQHGDLAQKIYLANGLVEVAFGHLANSQTPALFAGLTALSSSLKDASAIRADAASVFNEKLKKWQADAREVLKEVKPF